MKKVLLSAVAILFAGTMMAQTIVSTTPQNRNAIIEELTGINCVWCPAGHKVVNEILADYPDRVVGINVHAGYFSQGSPYNTTHGTAYDNQANPDSYPAGTVNRHFFSGNTTVLSRGDFRQAAQAIMGMASPVNVAAVGRINEATRQLELHIEIYYTANSSVATNYLNIAVLQNNVLGPQTGGESNYPEMMVNGQYRHMHMLRDMLTGTWGEAIPATQGTFIDTTIIWDIPQAIGQVAIPDPKDLDFVVFIAEGHQEILTGVKATIITETPSLFSFRVNQTSDCSLDYQPYVTINNTTENDLVSLEFTYNGANYTSTKFIPALTNDTVNLPLYSIVPGTDPVQNCTATHTVSLDNVTTDGGDDLYVGSEQLSFTFAEFNIYRVAGPLQLRAVVDGWASEASVELVKQANCSTEWTWRDDEWTDIGPSANSVQYISQLYDGRPSWLKFDPAAGLYILRIVDSYGDGWRWTNNSHPSGIWLNDANGEVIADSWGYTNGPSFAHYDYYINVTTNGDGSHLGIEDAEPMVNFAIYPNPVNNRMTIECSEAIRQAEVIDISGRTVITTNTTSINTAELPAGVYMLRLVTNNGVSTQKFVKE